LDRCWLTGRAVVCIVQRVGSATDRAQVLVVSSNAYKDIAQDKGNGRCTSRCRHTACLRPPARLLARKVDIAEDDHPPRLGSPNLDSGAVERPRRYIPLEKLAPDLLRPSLICHGRQRHPAGIHQQRREKNEEHCPYARPVQVAGDPKVHDSFGRECLVVIAPPPTWRNARRRLRPARRETVTAHTPPVVRTGEEPPTVVGSSVAEMLA
jgi:hypothetical protein